MTAKEFLTERVHRADVRVAQAVKFARKKRRALPRLLGRRLFQALRQTAAHNVRRVARERHNEHLRQANAVVADHRQDPIDQNRRFARARRRADEKIRSSRIDRVLLLWRSHGFTSASFVASSVVLFSDSSSPLCAFWIAASAFS